MLTLRQNTTDLFDNYLGQRTRRQIFGGLTHRGDGENIRVAILYCDMHNSTGLAEQLPSQIYLDLLNGFFERVAEPVLERGGEVLQFIGDAVLAIFPLEEDKDSDAAAVEACWLARAAAEEIVARIAAAPSRADHPIVQCGVGLHFGDVMYGNVGSPRRLDFTVIGSAPILRRASAINARRLINHYCCPLRWHAARLMIPTLWANRNCAMWVSIWNYSRLAAALARRFVRPGRR